MSNHPSLLWLAALLASCLVATAANASEYSRVIESDSPVSYWRLGDSGAVAVDVMGVQDGTLVGGITTGEPGAIAGDADSAMLFDGSTGWIDVPFQAAHNAPSFSVEVWAQMLGGNDSSLWRAPINSRSGNANGGTGYNLYGGANDQWQFWVGRDKVNGPGDHNWTYIQSSTAPVVIGDWVHLVGTYDAASAAQTFFVDGQKIGEAIEPYFQQKASGGAQVGRLTGFWFDGRLDELAIYNEALSPGKIATHYATGVTGVLPGPADLLVYHLDEGAGTFVHDSVGLEPRAEGTVHGASWTTGKFGSALSFDGTDDYVQTAQFRAGNYSELTVEAWVNWGSKEGKQVVFSEQSDDTLWMNVDTGGDDKFNVYLGNTSVKGYHSSNATVPRGVWTHLAFTYDDDLDELSLYINGQLDRTVTTSGLLGFDSTVAVGIREDLTTDVFEGLIDELAVYSRALTADEILARALGGPPLAVPEPSGILLAAVGLLFLTGIGRRSRRV